MLTIEDLRNPVRKSGFNYVTSNGKTGSSHAWRAEKGQKQKGVAFEFRGTGRKTSEQAAQDYCDYVNGGTATAALTLKSAGHPMRKRDRKLSASEAAAQATLNAARKKRDDGSGYVYLIGEEGNPSMAKIGKSRPHPKYRLARLQTGNPRKLYVLDCYFVEDRAAEEARLHAMFIDKNVLGEWFFLTTKIKKHFKAATEGAAKPKEATTA